MPQAAREMDLLEKEHTGLLGVGSGNVEIENKAASRMGDDAVCFGNGVVNVHIQVWISTGSATVFINDFPAARVGDLMACGTTIFTGAATVEIGGAAFGMSSETIGNITIRGSPEFIARVKADLAKLDNLYDGRLVLSGLQDVTILEYSGPNSFTLPLRADDAGNGTGSPAVVGYNPNLTLEANVEGGGTAPTPPEVILGHELIHAMHQNEGASPGGEEEEEQTIGYPGTESANNPPTENGMRDEMGQEEYGQRIDHEGVSGRSPDAAPGPVQ